MANIALSGATSDTLTCYADNLDISYSLYDRVAYWGIGLAQSSVQWVGSSLIPAYVSSGGQYTFTGLTANTFYVVSCYITTNIGVVWLDDIYAATTAPSRPDLFAWTYPKVSGEAFNLTATEWNSLTANINGVRNYKGLSSWLFTAASYGSIFTANMYNEAVNAIKDVPGYGSWLNTVNSGDIIYAYQMNNLVSELNAIP